MGSRTCFFAWCILELLALLVLDDHPMGVLVLLDKFLSYLCKVLSYLTQKLSSHGMSGWSQLSPSSILNVPELQISFVLECKRGNMQCIPWKCLAMLTLSQNVLLGVLNICAASSFWGLHLTHGE